jgi:N-acylneuraminate cytidylyltransferase
MVKREYPNSTIAIIFAREDVNKFDRCSFPILGRPVVSYPIMAALASKKIDKTYLSTQSKSIIQIAKAFDRLKVIERGGECKTVIEEFQRSLSKVIDDLKQEPTHVVLLLGNSPCVLSKTIDNALEILESKPQLDSVVTVVKRREFRPTTPSVSLMKAFWILFVLTNPTQIMITL